jgi:hypothetical protein
VQQLLLERLHLLLLLLKLQLLLLLLKHQPLLLLTHKSHLTQLGGRSVVRQQIGGKRRGIQVHVSTTVAAGGATVEDGQALEAGEALAQSAGQRGRNQQLMAEGGDRLEVLVAAVQQAAGRGATG